MKKNLLKVSLALCCLLGASTSYSQQIAFPGAEGFGKYAQGPRATAGGSVYRVINLNDSGTGSFRDAVSSPGRYIIFDVAGVIKINSPIAVSANTYIAGQTAPGEGITIYGDGISFSGANNAICRYIRVRAGKNSTREDAFGLANGQNIIFDHVSIAWGRDETFSVTTDSKSNDSRNITIQNSIISQGLLSHSAGGLCEPNGEITVFRTLFIDSSTRNFKMKGTTQYVNNIVYNWKNAAYIMGGNSAGTHYANAVSNYFIVGPNGGKQAFSNGNSKYNLYTEDNLVDKDRNGILDGTLVPEDDYTTYDTGGDGTKTPRNPTFVSAPYDYPELPVVPAADLFNELVGNVGASLPYRDNLDLYLIDELKSLGLKGTIITNENELPIGIPTAWNLWGGNVRSDRDNDGIPDEWEVIIGSNPDVNDALTIRDDKGGYTNIELYFNSITAENSQYYLKAPINLQANSVTQSEIQLEWLDVTENELGYIIEENISGTFSEIGRTGKGITNYLISGLEPESTHIYRIKAYDATSSTDYTNELTVKTKPVPVVVEDPETFVPDAIWTGAASTEWDLTSANWSTGTFAADQKILFDETATSKTVNLTSNMSQGIMFVKGNEDYTFTGEGAIAGAGSVNKTGNGVLTLNDNNTYTGATVIHNGVMSVNKLADGGVASSIGASPAYDFNWVWNGGTIRYTGASVSTNRSAAIDKMTEFEVTDPNSVVTFTGTFSGNNGFTKTGPGKIVIKATTNNGAFANAYSGETVIKEGTIELEGVDAMNNGLGASDKLVLSGGTLKTVKGSNTIDENYTFDIEVNGETESVFEPYRNCQIKGNVSGSGDLKINVSYVREYITGNWDNFIGTLTVNGIGGSNDGSQFQIYNPFNGAGMPNARVVTAGNVKILSWKNAATIYLGGLSGPAGTYLACADKNNNGASVTWVVGGINTDEEFKGIINNECSNKSYNKGKTSIVKEGDGYWRLTGNNIHSGTTTVNQGNLIVNGAHTGTGAVTINDRGTLSGKGSLAAAVTVNEGGILDPGDLGIGTFTIKNAVKIEAGAVLNIDVDRSNSTCDKLTSTGAVTIEGDLNINLVDGNFTNGNEITIMSAASCSGKFANIIPSVPAEGLYWDTTDLYTAGILRVSDQPSGIYDNKIYEVITSSNGNITIGGLISEKAISVYNLSGVLVFSTMTASDCNIQVGSGMYFVKIGNKTTKILVQ